MKKYIIISAVFMSGCAIGATAGVLATRKHYSDLANKEIAEACAYYRKEEPFKVCYNVVDYPNAPDHDVDIGYIEEEEQATYVKAATRYHSSYTKPSLETLTTSLAEAEYPEDDDSEDQDAVIDDPHIQEVFGSLERPEPYVIDENEFAYDADGYERCTVTYYAGDHTLCDTDESIMGIEATIGYDAIEAFADGAVRTVYVRNNRLGIDYEIEWSDQSYTEYILGIEPDDNPPRKRNRRDEE